MLRFWFGLALSALMVVLALAYVDIGQLAASLRSARFGLIGVAALLLTTTQFIKGWRWYYLMESIKPIRYIDLTSATSIGAMVDMVLPARAGELVRAVVLGQREQVSKLASLATIVVEKVLDVVTVLLMSVPLVLLVRLPGGDAVAGSLQSGIVVATAVSVALVLGLVLLRLRTEEALRVVERGIGLLPYRIRTPALHYVGTFVGGLQTIRGMRHLVWSGALTVLLWTVFALGNLLVLRAFALDVPAYAAFILLAFQVLGVTLPSSPGFIGTYHAAVVAGLVVLGVSSGVALSVAIAMHAAFFFPFIALGLGFLWRENLSWKALRSMEAEAGPTPEPEPEPAMRNGT